jgi:transposase
MNATTTYGVDIAKNVMQVHWVELSTGEIKRKKITRAKFSEFFAQRQAARVAMEACGGSHHWARTLTPLGHQVELLPASQVRAFVKSNKDDAADARAIWLAAHQSDIRRVPVKSCDQQAVLSLHRVRKHWVDVRTATINMLRGLLYEFGVALPAGKHAGLRALGEQRARIEQDLPAPMLRMLDAQLLAIKELQQRADACEAEIAAMHKNDDAALRLRQVPGIGLLGSTALAAVLGDGAAWRNGRDFSCSLGLVPRHSGTGGKVRIGNMSKRGDPYLRNLLISGARSLLCAPSAPDWAKTMLQRRPFNVVVVALAHKLARTAWALVAHGRRYDGQWNSRPQDAGAGPASASAMAS